MTISAKYTLKDNMIALGAAPIDVAPFRTINYPMGFDNPAYQSACWDAYATASTNNALLPFTFCNSTSDIPTNPILGEIVFLKVAETTPGGVDPITGLPYPPIPEHYEMNFWSGSSWAKASSGSTASITDFGAVGDGITDDSDALIAAIAAVAARPVIDNTDYAQGGGGKVFCPRGVYKITKQIAWTADGVVIEGEGENATAFKVAIASSPDTTDVFVAGDGSGNGRRAEFKNLSIFTDTNFGANKCRDFIVIRAGVWFKITNVNLRGAGRYGLRIAGTYHGKVDYLRTVYNGNSGVCIENEGATPQTSTAFMNLYSGYNWKHGVHLRQANTVHMYMPVIEYNGQNGDPTNGNGIRMGDTALDVDVGCVIHGGYFESNKGWDILTGVGSTTSQHLLSLHACWATTQGGSPKTSAYGFLYASRTAGESSSVYLADYTNGLGYKTYSLDSSCKFNVMGVPAGGLNNANSANAPVIRDLGGLLDDYEGLIEWYDENAVRCLRGRYALRIGNMGTGLASAKLQRGSGVPVSGTYGQGDLLINYSATTDTGRWPFAWRCVSGGTPGSWEPLFCSSEPDNGMVIVPATAGTNGIDGSYRSYGIQFNTDVAANIASGSVNDGDGLIRKGRILIVIIRNASGGNLTAAAWTGAGWKWAGNAAPAWPTNGNSNILTFVCDGSPGSLLEVSRSLEVPY